MCDERERLLDYLYDVSDVEERRKVDAHLAGCAECREELNGLRAVRLDLLAWDVPPHDSVWKPFAPRRVNPWWREVPAWGLAAAASIMFALGLAGGFAARVIGAAPVTAQAPVLSPAPILQPTPTLTAAQSAEMEQRVLNALLVQLESKPVSAHAQPAAAVVLSPMMKQQIEGQMRALILESERRQGTALRSAVKMMVEDSEQQFVRRTQFNNFKNRELPANLQYVVQQALMQQGGR